MSAPSSCPSGMPDQVKVTWSGNDYTFDRMDACYWTETGGIGDLYLNPGVAWTLDLSSQAPNGPSTGTRAETSVYGAYSNGATISAV